VLQDDAAAVAEHEGVADNADNSDGHEDDEVEEIVDLAAVAGEDGAMPEAGRGWASVGVALRARIDEGVDKCCTAGG